MEAVAPAAVADSSSRYQVEELEIVLVFFAAKSAVWLQDEVGGACLSAFGGQKAVCVGPSIRGLIDTGSEAEAAESS